MVVKTDGLNPVVSSLKWSTYATHSLMSGDFFLNRYHNEPYKNRLRIRRTVDGFSWFPRTETKHDHSLNRFLENLLLMLAQAALIISPTLITSILTKGATDSVTLIIGGGFSVLLFLWSIVLYLQTLRSKSLILGDKYHAFELGYKTLYSVCLNNFDSQVFNKWLKAVKLNDGDLITYDRFHQNVWQKVKPHIDYTNTNHVQELQESRQKIESEPKKAKNLKPNNWFLEPWIKLTILDMKTSPVKFANSTKVMNIKTLSVLLNKYPQAAKHITVERFHSYITRNGLTTSANNLWMADFVDKHFSYFDDTQKQLFCQLCDTLGKSNFTAENSLTLLDIENTVKQALVS